MCINYLVTKMYNLSAARTSEGNSQKYQEVKCLRYRYGMGGSFEHSLFEIRVNINTVFSHN